MGLVHALWQDGSGATQPPRNGKTLEATETTGATGRLGVPIDEFFYVSVEHSRDQIIDRLMKTVKSNGSAVRRVRRRTCVS